MVKKVIKDEKVSTSEAENKKGFHITIVDLDSGKKTLDIDTKMILGAKQKMAVRDYL